MIQLTNEFDIIVYVNPGQICHMEVCDIGKPGTPEWHLGVKIYFPGHFLVVQESLQDIIELIRIRGNYRLVQCVKEGNE